MSLPAGFPSSLDSLANPTATTNRDDPGFELDAIIARIQDILEALEAKVGIGASLPSTAGVLRRTAPGATAWGQVVGADIAAGGTANRVLATVDGATAAMQQVVTAMVAANAVGERKLDYVLASDVNGVTVNNSAFVDLFANQSFTLDQASSVVLFLLSSNVLGLAQAANVTAFAQLLIDSSNAPQASQTRRLGGDFGLASGNYIHPLLGGGAVAVTNLLAGTHTVRVQMCTVAGTFLAYCRPSGLSENFQLQVVEIKR